MKIYFYLSPSYWLDPIPTLKNVHLKVNSGAQAWIIRTYLILLQTNLECDLVNKVPDEGIIICHKGAIDDNFIPSKKQLLVCIQSDWGRHDFAGIHICQNPNQESNMIKPMAYNFFFPGKTYFVRYWPQSHIKPRALSRANILSSISYFGIKDNLAQELQSADWANFIARHGLIWNVYDERAQYSDYSETDVVLFCRDFKGLPHHHKPATKLYNSWIAGCVPVFTPESAYIYERKNHPESSVMVGSYDCLKTVIEDLVKYPNRFEQLRKNAIEASAQYSIDAITDDWVSMINRIKADYLMQQKQSRLRYQMFITVRSALHVVKNIFG